MAKAEPALERAVYNVREVAALLNINLTSSYELTRRQDFPALRINRRIVVPKEAFHRWLERQAVGCVERG